MAYDSQIVDLAVSVYHNPGVYALLLGSGLSRAAGIPTAWGIVEDLIRKVAVANGTQSLPQGDALFSWYQETYQTEATYSDLIARLEPTQAGQRNLLRSYFERPTDEGQFIPHEPSEGHRSIARLCQAGFIRMVITTNFDRLLEQALSELGVIPTVISNHHELDAAPPYVHGGVYLLKLHGDYLKDDVRNSPADLETYPETLKTYLDRVLDEFGLIVCGWSGEWDHALRNSILQAPNRRYPLVWSALTTPTQAAQQIIDARAGRTVTGPDADGFFTQLEGRVLALRDLHWVPPAELTELAAVAKRFMGHPVRDGAKLTDLIETVCDELNQTIRQPETLRNIETFEKRLQWVVGVCQPLLHIVGAILKYDRTGEWTTQVRESLTRIDWDVRIFETSMNDTERQLLRLPLLLIGLAVAGLAAAYNKPEVLTFLSQDPYRQPNQTRYSPVEVLLRSASLNDNFPNTPLTQRAAPNRYWALEVLVKELKDYLHPGTIYEDLQVGELLIALVALNETGFARPGQSWMTNEVAVQGTHLYNLNPEVARTRLFKLFEPGLKTLPQRLGVQNQKVLAAAYDEAAPRAVHSRYDYGTGGFRADMAALVGRAFD